MTPAQLAVLAVVDAHGSSMISSRTWRAMNTVHVSAARALVRAGVLVESLGPDGTYVSRPPSLPGKPSGLDAELRRFLP